MSDQARAECLRCELRELQEAVENIWLNIRVLNSRLVHLGGEQRPVSSVGISGLPGSWTITPPPEWDGELVSEIEGEGERGE